MGTRLYLQYYQLQLNCSHPSPQYVHEIVSLCDQQMLIMVFLIALSSINLKHILRHAENGNWRYHSFHLLKNHAPNSTSLELESDQQITELQLKMLKFAIIVAST